MAATLVPGELLNPQEADVWSDPWRHVERSFRDWVVDLLALVLAALLGLLFFASDADTMDTSTAWMDASVGLVCLVAVWLRRRFPLEVGILTGLAGAVSTSAGGACLVGVFTVAVHRRAALAVAVGALNCAAAAVFFAWRPDGLFDTEDATPLWVAAGFVSAVYAGLVAWGMVVRSRRQLVLSLRERVERAEGEQRLRADQARAAERARIAREMHDVVAHRVTLVALHAGALEMRPDLPPAEIARTAELIRTTARAALEELRSVVGVLRNPGDADEAAPQAPQPALVDIARLVEESRRAGMRVELTLEAPDPAPGPLGRDAYRIVQEALTNVAKHASGAVTEVAVTGAPGDGLAIRVRNRLPAAAVRSWLPGAGAGLLGLAERVELAGGTLRHGRTDDGDFEVAADLLWPVP